MDIRKLRDAVEYNYERQLDKSRKLRLAFMAAYVGHHQGGAVKSPDKKPANDINRFINSVVNKLITQTPQGLITTQSKELKVTAEDFNLAVNQRAKKMKIEDELRKMLIEALISPIGVLKIALGNDGAEIIDDKEILFGNAYVENVPFSRLSVDMDASEPNKFSFIADLFELPLDYVKKSKLFKNTANLEATSPSNPSNKMDDPYSHEKNGRENIVEKVLLWNVYVPSENKIYVLAADSPTDKPLLEEEWTGPEGGPYRFLVLEDIPDYPLGSPPVAQLYDLDDANNRILNKLIRGAEQQKNLILVSRGGGKDARKINNARDWDSIGVDQPDKVRQVSYGGYSTDNLIFYLRSTEILSKQANNLDLMTGAAPQSKTATQDKILSEASNEMIKGIQTRFYKVLKQVFRDLAFWSWEDSFFEEKITKKVGDIEIEKSFTEEDKLGNFIDYNFDIDIFSLVDLTPQERLMGLENFVINQLPRLQPHMQAQGIAFNVQAYFDKYAKYSRLVELQEMLVSGVPIANQEQIGEPPQTKTYERISRPGNTQTGQNTLLQNALLGQNNMETTG